MAEGYQPEPFKGTDYKFYGNSAIDIFNAVKARKGIIIGTIGNATELLTGESGNLSLGHGFARYDVDNNMVEGLLFVTAKKRLNNFRINSDGTVTLLDYIVFNTFS